MDIKQAKKIHFIGISGIGTSGLAKLCLEMGKKVSGSDLVESIITEGLKKSGAKIYLGKQKAKNIAKDVDLVVYSNAVPETNIERKEAFKRNIRQMSYPQALGSFTRDKKLICISGMHGKTTTTAMISKILKDAGFDPTFIVGSYLPEIRGNACLGKSDFVVIEADEYERAMLNYYPDYIVLNNIEEDHLDTYKDLADIIHAFRQYVEKLALSGVLVANADNKNVNRITRYFKGNKITFGLKKGDFQAKKIRNNSKGISFEVKNIEVNLRVPGRYNIYNALAAFALAWELGIKPMVIKKSLEKFKGTWRRFELIGKYKGIDVISDYAHHPTEIENLIKAAKEKYPKKRIVMAYQPHQHNRTKKLFNGFVKELAKADVLILNEIFDVSGRENKEDLNVSSRDLLKEIKLKNKSVFYGKDLKATTALVKKVIKKGDVLLIVGAGDIYKIGEKLVK